MIQGSSISDEKLEEIVTFTVVVAASPGCILP